jgi:hypothetical protein
MPSKMLMNINTRNPSQSQIASYVANQSNLAQLPRGGTSQLNSPMIGRILSIKPGCGSCGKK